MTMDVNRRKNGIKSEVTSSSSECEEKIATTKPTKRPFDVAFLMLPDERLKNRHKSDSNLDNNNVKVTSCDSQQEIKQTESISITPIDLHKLQGHQKYFQTIPTCKHQQQVFDDPVVFRTNNKTSTESEIYVRPKLIIPDGTEQKSAFTKVNLIHKERSGVSPNLSISPDLNYQQSLSPSPPRNVQNFHSPSLISSPTQVFRAQNIPQYQIQDTFSSPHSSPDLETHFAHQKNQSDILHSNYSKMRPMLSHHHYRPDLSYNYPQFSPQEMLKIGSPNPAAAILTTLLPPSLAALSLPAQNVCAKCNVSFRMTSDLVYHMRSHHKNDAVDVTKRKREEKLKCPVCTASFRERHHLTRHMTAHQDKDEDEDEPKESKKKIYQK